MSTVNLFTLDKVKVQTNKMFKTKQEFENACSAVIQHSGSDNRKFLFGLLINFVMSGGQFVNNGTTPTFRSAFRQTIFYLWTDAELLQLLLEKEKEYYIGLSADDVPLVDSECQGYPLMWIYVLKEPCSARAFELLLEFGADPNKKFGDKPPLYGACNEQNYNIEVIKVLAPVTDLMNLEMRNYWKGTWSEEVRSVIDAELIKQYDKSKSIEEQARINEACKNTGMSTCIIDGAGSGGIGPTVRKQMAQSELKEAVAKAINIGRPDLADFLLSK